MTTPPLKPGLLVLHGNRLEDLAAVVLRWLAEHPLAPLEEETLLVQSNGMAEWLKMQVAGAHGVCAAARVELPARFVWRAWRAVLGRDAVPALSPLDKLPLAWRLMRLLPELLAEPVFAPVSGFLSDGDPLRRLQLAQRLADLFDQYQVHRGDWLADWAAGRDALLDANGMRTPVPDAQRWQPALWRALLATLADDEGAAARPLLHRRFVAALDRGDTFPRLPRRIVLFGTTHVPQPTLEAVAALARHCQVLVAVPNPCRVQWADAAAAASGHPLLAAWGRQSRDFIGQLDAWDDRQAARERFGLPRLDLFDDKPPTTLLQQVQAALRDGLPLAEHAFPAPTADDRSIVFHVAHSAQREVEVLHDQLLELLARPPGGTALAPRDIVVMVPDIDAFAPAIASVFGQHARGDARHIPWGIADLQPRRHDPLIVAVEWLLRAPQQRFTATELLGLLEVPAIARRLGLRDGDRARIEQWIAAAGVRWGLAAAQRATLGLEACGDSNTWAFGVRRLLLGYATGDVADGGGFAGIEPCAEAAGLAAGVAGTLAEWLASLQAWWADAAAPRTPADWAARLRALLAALFDAEAPAERAAVAALDDALAAWLSACDAAGFDDALALDVVREAWLAAVNDPTLAQRFKAGGVTFCTLLPLRAIPFDVVCLLGMNDGDYPRRATRSDFDLMGLPGQARPGDRSRRDDDRQLMLDALLSARRVLHVSWAGRSQRDNEIQPPSVLVAQLRDHLAAGWGAAALAQRTVEHPLQPFARAYFEGRGGLFTYAAEWRAAFDTAPANDDAAPAPEADEQKAVTLDELVRFLRNPVKAFFRRRLNVVFDEPEAAADDDEPFDSAGLDRWRQVDDVLREAQRRVDDDDDGDLPARVTAQLERLQRAGSLPLAGPGQQVIAELQRVLQPMLAQWQQERAARPLLHARLPLRAGLLDDGLVGLRSADAGGTPAFIELRAGRLLDKKGKALRRDKLLAPWLRLLAAGACGTPSGGALIASDVVVTLAPLADGGATRRTLFALIDAWGAGAAASRPLPTAVCTGIAWLAGGAALARKAYEGSKDRPGEVRDECLARLFPDWETLAAQPGFEAATRRLYEAFCAWCGSVAFEPLPGAAADDEDDE